MAVNTTTFESTLQTKLNDTTLAAKEMLLLGKALESTVGSIAVSDINTAGATKVSEINAVASNTFKTVGGTSILGSGNIEALPAGGTVGQVVTNTASGTGGWADAAAGGKVLQVAFGNGLLSTGSWTDTSERNQVSLAFTPLSSTSTLYITAATSFQVYGNSTAPAIGVSFKVREGSTDIADYADIHWNPQSSNIFHYTPQHTSIVKRASGSTSSRTYTTVIKKSVTGGRLDFQYSYGPVHIQIIEVEA